MNSDEKWLEQSKRFHTAPVVDWHKQWLWETPDLQMRERLSKPPERYKQRVVISRKCFSKYIPNHVQKKDYLSQFACETGVEFEWLHKDFIKTLQDNHQCGDPNKCANWRAPMGTQCTCPTCTKCLITELQSIAPLQLLKSLCVHSDDYEFPHLDCALGECFNDECFSDKYKRIVNGTGCDTLNIADDEMIYYYKFKKFPLPGKNKKCRTRVGLPWHLLKQKYIDKLEEYLFHRYTKEWQEHVREIITHPINNTIRLPENFLYTSFDYGGNISCAPERHPHSGSLCESSMMAGHEVKNINGKLHHTAVILLSNQSSHGWYSAIPSYKIYIKKKKEEFRNRGKTLSTHIFGCDRGPTDFWAGSFITYAIDICYEEAVNLHMDTTGAGHGKHIHDTLISVTKRKVAKGFKQPGLIPIGSEDSIAGRTCSYLRSEYAASQETHQYKWQFIEVPAQDIIVANSPTKRILTTANKGIQTYHSLHSDTSGNIKMNVQSCACVSCISSGWTKCDNNRYVGHWVDCKPIQDHPIYESIQPKKVNPRKRPRVSIDFNYNNRY